MTTAQQILTTLAPHLKPQVLPLERGSSQRNALRFLERKGHLKISRWLPIRGVVMVRRLPQVTARQALRKLVAEAKDWQYVLGEGDRPTLDRALAYANQVLGRGPSKDAQKLIMYALVTHSEFGRWKTGAAAALAERIRRDGLEGVV